VKGPVRVVMFVLASLVAAAGASPAGAQSLSESCQYVDSAEMLDGSYFQGAVGGHYLAGETITVRATGPTSASVPTTIVLQSPFGTVVDTAAFPGTVSYTFSADVRTDLTWSTNSNGNVTWAVSCQASALVCTITGAGDVQGTDGDDIICGSAGPDRIAGNGGNDQILGFGGDDQLIGGEGNDILLGGDGNDQLIGGAGDDQLFGGLGVDHLFCGTGDDLLNSLDGTGTDNSVGGDHEIGDTCVGDSGDVMMLCE
jgi:Ca2+-binding RTX toxin-like protein